MEENYYGSPVAIATRRLQAASTDSATSQPISVPLNHVVSRQLDKLIYDILNENIPKYVSLFIFPLRPTAVQQCVQRNLGNTAAVRVEMKVCGATLLASVETRNLVKTTLCEETYLHLIGIATKNVSCMRKSRCASRTVIIFLFRISFWCI